MFSMTTDAALIALMSERSHPASSGCLVFRSYTITVTNTGLENVNGAVVTDTFPAQVQNVTYTATGNGGATGFSAASGNISQSLTLPPNSSVAYKATGFISGNSGNVISNTANLSVPAGVSDPNTANNTATDKDTIQ